MVEKQDTFPIQTHLSLDKYGTVQKSSTQNI